MQVNMSKKYVTVEGNEVQIYSVDNGGDYPVHGRVRLNGPAVRWGHESWTLDGKRLMGCPHTARSGDLVEVKNRFRGSLFINLYCSPAGVFTAGNCYLSPREADACSRLDETRFACIEVDVDCEDGTGLDRTDLALRT